MPLDSVFLSGLQAELAPQILGARIDKVQQPERDLLLLSLRGHDFWCTAASAARVCI